MKWFSLIANFNLLTHHHVDTHRNDICRTLMIKRFKIQISLYDQFYKYSDQHSKKIREAFNSTPFMNIQSYLELSENSFVYNIKFNRSPFYKSVELLKVVKI